MQNKEKPEFLRQTYIREDMPGQTFTFARLCESYGVKYSCVATRVKKKGMTVGEAIEDCMKTPSTWGVSYVTKKTRHLVE